MTDSTATRSDTERTREKLSDRQIRSLPAPEAGNRITYDGQLSGFGIRVTASGKKAFVLNYTFAGRERRITIGSYPEWSLTAARLRASELRRSIDLGVDPLARRQEHREAPTVRDLYDRYVRDYVPKLSTRSQADAKAMFLKLILPRWAGRKVREITFDDCEELHRFVSRKRPTKANRLHSLMRRVFNLAIQWGWIEINPARGIERNPEEKRERYLTSAEISRLLGALEAHHERSSCDAITLMLYTGCRRGEALNATWDQFDEQLGIWTKPASATKQRKLHRVPLSGSARRLLLARKTATESNFVFPSRTGKALTDIKRTWTAVSSDAGLSGVRLHDLRHTFASLAVSAGHSLPLIGAMLGHSQTQTTARYAHLFDHPLQRAADTVARSIDNSRQKGKRVDTKRRPTQNKNTGTPPKENAISPEGKR